MKKSLIVVALGLFLTTQVTGQNAPVNFTVHEDVVKPSMNVQYREALKKLKSACEQHKISFGWTAVALDNNTYHFLSPLKSFAELDKNPFADLEAKMGKEALGKIWTALGQCVESQTEFVIALLPQFSYLTPVEGENNLYATFLYFEGGKEMEGEAILAEWKKLYETKKVPTGYSLYKYVFGHNQGYIFVSSGKSVVDTDMKDQKAIEMLGEEGGKLFAKTLAITKSYSNMRADVVPEFSYTAPVATK